VRYSLTDGRGPPGFIPTPRRQVRAASISELKVADE